MRDALLTPDVVCEHGVAMDVHCCNCHGGFLFDADSCVCVFEPERVKKPVKTLAEQWAEEDEERR